MSAPYPTQSADAEQKQKLLEDQSAYPPSTDTGYAQGAYPPNPQGAYPPQPQPQGGGYPPPQAVNYQPPPYQPGPNQFSQPQAQQQQNVVVVTQPGVPPTQVRQRPQREVGIGIGATIAAVFTTIFLASFVCWWALPCSIIAIVLGITSTSAGDSGNISSAKNQAGISIACTVGAWFTAVIGVAIIVGVAAGIVNARVNSLNNGF